MGRSATITFEKDHLGKQVYAVAFGSGGVAQMTLYYPRLRQAENDIQNWISGETQTPGGQGDFA